MKQGAKTITMTEVFNNPRFQGKHVILAAGKVYTAKTGEDAAKILKRIRKQLPDITPEVTFLPKAHSLTLLGRLGFLETFDTEFQKSHLVIFKNH